MPHPREDELLASLPADVAARLRQAFASADPKSQDAAASLKGALEGVRFPGGRTYPLASALSPEQRAVAELLAYRDGFSVFPAAMPAFALRKRWLSLEPGGVLETEQVDAEGQRVPLWHALQLAGFDYARMGALLNALPIERALGAFAELFPFGYNIDANSLWTHGKLRLPGELRGEGREWALEQANRWSKEPSLARALPMRWLIFTALVRARVPIDPSWDVLLPLGDGPLTRELVRALPAERRAAAVAGALKSGERPSSGILPALEVLAEFPLPEIAQAVLSQADAAGEFQGKAEVRLRLIQIAAQHPALQSALGLAPVVAAPAAPEPPPEPEKKASKPSSKKAPAAKKPVAAKKPAAKKPVAAKKPAAKKPAAKKKP